MAGKCVICGEHDARYVCEVCGRGVCEDCFDPRRWVCADCLSKMVSQTGRPVETLTRYQSNWLLRLFFFGFITVFIGMVIMMASALLSGSEEVSGGALIFIGPIPIAIGYGPFALPFFILAIVFAIIGIIFFLVTRKR